MVDRVRPVKGTLSDDGSEVLDPDPVEVALGFQHPPSLSEQVHRMVQDSMLAAELDAHGVETFEDADDFCVADDPIDPLTPYEDGFDPAAPGIAARAGEVRAGLVQAPTALDVANAEAVLAAYLKAKAVRPVPPAVEPAKGQVKLPVEPEKVNTPAT